MSTPSRTPSWAEIESFCSDDEWNQTRTTDHKHFEKVLESGELLQTHTSLDRHGTMSQDRFGFILRTQLRVSRHEFWKAVQSGEPVERPVTKVEAAPPSHEPWVLRVLKNELHLSDDQIRSLSIEEGQERVRTHRVSKTQARPASGTQGVS